MVQLNTKAIIKPEVILLLNKLEEETGKLAQRSIEKDFPNLTLQYSLKISDAIDEHQKGTLIIGSNNSSFSKKGSLELAQKLIDFIRTSVQISTILPYSVLVLNMDFNVKDETNKQNKKNDESSTPTYNAIEPLYSFEMMVIPDDTISEIRDALKVIQCRDLIYEKWGFKEIEPIPKSILNFYGEPGTGKTMCAHAIAKEMGKKLLALNYAQIESKYVGDAPKNLQAAFDEAQKCDAILFFDEADSFLGKRIQNVTQGAEQALNSLRSQMLILLEKFSGIVIFATNLVTNYDNAFESRILKHIKFSLPGLDARMSIIKKMIPSKLPLEKPLTEDDYKKLGELTEGMSGREIKNAVHETLLSKADINNSDFKFSNLDFEFYFDKKKQSLEALKKEEENNIKNKIFKKIKERNLEEQLNNKKTYKHKQKK